MSRGFVKEGDQEEIPMVLPRAFLPTGTPNYVTPEGLKLLQEEMEDLKKQWSDAGINYVTKNYIDAKMRLLSERINNAVLVDPAKANPDVVSFGMYVRYNDKVIRIVGVDEADASKGLVSFISPIAKALIGRRKGDKFEIKVPRGIELIEIQEVASFICDELRSMSHEQNNENNERKAIKKEVVKTNIQTSETPHKEVGSKLSDSQSLNFSDPEKTKNSESMVQSSKFISEINPTEFLPLVNEQGNIVGRALYCEIHNGNKVLHPAIHLLIYNNKKEIVAKYWWHVAFGETAEKTLKRKLKEMESHVETYGRMSQTIKPKFKKQYIREDKSEKELVSVFTAITGEEEVLPSPEGKDYDRIFEKSVLCH